MVTRIPVNMGGRPSLLRSGSYSESSNLSLGDLSLLSVVSFHDDNQDKGNEGRPIWCKRARDYIRLHPIVREVKRRYKSVPKRYKWLCLVLWVSWKFVAAFLLVYLVQSSSSSQSATDSDSVLRILYMVTTSHLQQSTASTWIESVRNLVNEGRHHVDVVLILGDNSVDSTVETQWRQNLPTSTTLTVWADATPWKNQDGRLVADTDALSLQHRSVMRDQWFNYNLFMQWDANVRIRATHVDYFWRQSQSLTATSEVSIPGIFEVGRAGNQTLSSESGPFHAQTCCNTVETKYMMNDASFLAKATSIKRLQDDAQRVLLPVSSANLHGWMMTQGQLMKLLQACPSFLPSVDDRAGHCSWQSWINLDPDFFSNHFVEQTAHVASFISLPPNRLWKDLSPKSVS